jgi:dipeptidyl-peptidase-3
MVIHTSYEPLGPAPATINTYKEIITKYNNNLPELFNALTPQERVIIYYLFRASLPGNIIATDQSHRDAVRLQELFEYIVLHKHMIQSNKKLPFDITQFLKEVDLYLVYLWTNHGQYFRREHVNEKRSPARLGLSILTKENLIAALQAAQYPHVDTIVESVAASLFNHTIEPTLSVPGSIKKSAVNFYAPDFTDKDLERIDPNVQTAVNAYFYLDKQNGQWVPTYQKYSVGGKYDQELQVAVYWLQKAYDHAKKYPDQFDKHFAESLFYLIEYLKTGDEDYFKKHSIEWLKSSSNIDYVYGFIETYDDPKSYRAIFQSDITIKSLAIDRLNEILPDLEDRLPFSEQFKRSLVIGAEKGMPNASINVKAFSAGSLGPLDITLAYCLPNYAEIRAKYGSKQIIYHTDKFIGELINPQLYHRLFSITDHYSWFQKYDSDYQLMRDITMLEIILHETLGHGSGQLTKHTFVEGDPLVISGKTYKVGDTIRVTSDNLPQLLGKYDQTLEELRAEIIALLASILFYDDLAQIGILKNWPTKVKKEKIIELSILNMMRTALRRYVAQSDEASEIAGAHAQANMTIMNYLIERGAVRLVQEPITTLQGFYTVLDARILSLERAIEVISELAQLVQRIKSTGNGIKAAWLIDTYGKPVNHEHMAIIKTNMQAVAGDVKVIATIYPHYEPISSGEEIIDVKATWPTNLQEQYLSFKDLALKMN